MGKSSSQVVGYRYYANFLAFIGNRIEDLLAINFDKRGWETGRQVPMGENGKMLYIHLPNIYGENEGGVSGALCLKYGSDTQSPDPAYKKYTDSFGSFAPAYPFQSYISFSGFELASGFSQLSEAELQELADQYNDGIIPGRGFYLGNSGYMKEMLLWVKRIHVKNNGGEQWHDDKSEVLDYSIESQAVTAVIAELRAILRTNVESTFDNSDYSGEEFYARENGEDLPVIHLAFTAAGGYLSAENETITYSYTSVGGGSSGYIKVTGYARIIGDRFSIIAGENTISLGLENKVTVGDEFSADVTGIFYLPENGGFSFSIRNSINNGAGGFGGNFILNLEWIDSYVPQVESGDINPIHKIREILTDDTAMGKPESDVNNVNFMMAADRIWGEGLGISWAIDEKSCIEAIEELCYHIEAGIRVNRQTGLYEMVLFRDDWFEEDEIHTIAENKIKDLSLEVMNSDDIVNQLNVTYYDRERIKNSTFSVYENGSILTMGHANAESIEFPYFMNMRNAEIVANWKLKQFSTPAWSGSFSTGWREARKWNRYDLIRLPWSKKWNGTILVRIMKINLGNGTDNTVTIDFEEVIPYSGEMNTSIVVDAPVESAPQSPQPSINVVFEAPYYLTVLRAGQTNTDLELSNNPDIGYLVAIAAKPQSNSLNALLYTDGGVGEFEQASRLDYCDILQLDQPITETASSFVVTGSLTQTANSNNFILLNDEWMGFVGFDNETRVLTVKRGVLDTIPKKHSSGSLFVFDLPDVAFDSTQYAQSEIVDAQVLTTTPSGIQELDASGQAIEIRSRAIRPYPPANVKFNEGYYPQTHTVTNNIVLTWVDRNRLQQTGGEILGFFDASVTAELGTTYSYELISENVVLDSANSIVANTVTIPASVLIQNKPHTLKLWSVRDGFDSYQKFEHSFFVEAASLILTATATSNGVAGNTVPTANLSVEVDAGLSANMQDDGSKIKGKAIAGATITIEVED